MFRYRIMVLALAGCLLMLPLGGCGRTATDTTEPNDKTENQLQQSAEEGTFVTLYFNDVITQEQEDALDEDGERNFTQTMVAQIPEDGGAEAVVTQYNELIIGGLYGETATVNNVSEKNGIIKVDFDSESLQNLNIEEGYEGQLFYNLARSIWANTENAEAVYLTMDNGKDFQLGHLWFEATRPFYYGEGPSDND